MTDETETGFSLISKAIDVTKTLGEQENDAAIETTQGDLQQLLLKALREAAQAEKEISELDLRCKKLERAFTELSVTKADKNKYELQKLDFGIFVYAFKSDTENPEPSHYLCTNCFDQNQKSILQPEGHNYRCGRCNASIRFKQPETKISAAGNTSVIRGGRR